MKTRVLLVEDDINLGAILTEFLKLRGYEVVHMANGEEGLRESNKNSYDLYILDVMMPKMDGLTLAREIRKSDELTPIIFLTAKSLQEDKIEGLKIADDYITKPFSSEELFLRIENLVKRSANTVEINSIESNVFEVGNYNFDYDKRILRFNEKERRLTSRESELLLLLCRNKNRITHRSAALEQIWHDDNYFNSRSMDVYITKLRSYLKNDPRIAINNIHGTGFKLVDTRD
jgi:DNA-binding response OmpR family regulator